MPRTEKVYPDWVQNYRTKGTTIKSVRGKYYLYKRTTKRIKGKKYPQAVDTYIGVITPDGITYSKRRMMTLTDVCVFEYGFSRTLWDLASESWKRSLGDDWEDVLRTIIHKLSPQTYLVIENEIKKEQDFTCQFPSQISMLSRKLYREYGFNIQDLDFLKSVYLVKYNEGSVISKLTDEQRIFVDKYNINMGVM